jgi:hypothetical protein
LLKNLKYTDFKNEKPKKDVGFEVLATMVITGSVFVNITPCSSLKVEPIFPRTMLSPSSELKSRSSKKPA